MAAPPRPPHRVLIVRLASAPLNPADQPAEKVAEFGADVNVKRPAQPEEIAPAYVFLAADSDASYITGEIISIFGGEPTN